VACVTEWYNLFMIKKEKISIFIDGGNFHHLVIKTLAIQEINFDFDAFAEFLANDRIITNQGKRFYIGTVREKIGDIRSKRAMSRQTRFFTFLKLLNWEIKTSKLRKRKEKIVIDDRIHDYKKILKAGIKSITFERTREKGIDVKMATDLIAGSIDNKFSTAIIVSSDTDLIPAMDWVKYRKHKKIEYVGFSIISRKNDTVRPSQGMITHSDIQRILVASDLKPFIKNKSNN